MSSADPVRDRRLRQRNYAVLGALLLWCVLIFCIAIVKMGAAHAPQ